MTEEKPGRSLFELGCIADDFTGAADLAGALRNKGWRVVLCIDRLPTDLDCSVDAVIVATKIRSCERAVALATAEGLARELIAAGAKRLFYKYCSTFDSTPNGNIGPVASAIADLVDCRAPVVCPAYPELGRQVFQGHLFVNGRLLSESGMERHPLTPMTDPDLVRWLSLQTSRSIGLCSFEDIAAGAAQVRAVLDEAGARDRCLIVCDAVDGSHLEHIAQAVAEDRFLSGATGLATGIAPPASAGTRPGTVPLPEGHLIGLVGSKSKATERQVATQGRTSPVFTITSRMAMEMDDQVVLDLVHWAYERKDDYPILVAAAPGASPSADVSESFERLFAEVAAKSLEFGFRHIVVAGGETSTSVASRISKGAITVGPEVCPGVPVLLMGEEPRITITPKSGNFGPLDFFQVAKTVLLGGDVD